MKVKLTISVEREELERLRALSRKRKKSISALVGEYSRQETPPTVLAEEGIMKWAGAFANVVTDADFERDDRAGHELRKTKAYQLRKKRMKRKKA